MIRFLLELTKLTFYVAAKDFFPDSLAGLGKREPGTFLNCKGNFLMGKILVSSGTNYT